MVLELMIQNRPALKKVAAQIRWEGAMGGLLWIPIANCLALLPRE